MVDYNQELEKQRKLREQIAFIEENAKRYMTREAVMRYGNIKTAYPELAFNLAMMISEAGRQGKIGKIDDAALKDILSEISKNKKENRITRV